MSLLLLIFQRSIIYYPRGYSSERVENFPGTLLRYDLEGVGEQVSFLLENETTSEPVWVFCGGNGSVALDWVSFLRGASGTFVLFDLPGYGLCEGKASPATVRESMRGLKTIVGEKFPGREVAFLGHSIGAASALIGAEEFGAKRMVLISPFTTMTEMAQRSVGWPLCYLNLHRYDNRAGLRSLQQRGGTAAVFHGVEDNVIPVDMSRELAVEFSEMVTLIEVPGAGHNDILGVAEPQILAAIR